MSPTIAEILDRHVTLELESIDRLYLNGYIPGLQSPGGVAWFLRHRRDARFASSAQLWVADRHRSETTSGAPTTLAG